MRRLAFLLILVIFNLSCFAFAGDSIPHAKKRINIVLSNKASQPDPALMSFHTQAWWNQLFHRKKFRFIIANTLDEAVDRISKILAKENALIGNLWFDSHGHMGRRVSLLEIGDIELNYQSIKEPWIKERVSVIGRYCDSLTNISLGSCYSGAVFYSGGTTNFPSQRMNGDSLMIEMANLMNQATIYGSVSWVTTKAGLFNAGYANAGGLWAKRFKDPQFKHAWDSLGVWRSYKISEGFRYVNTVSLDREANIRIAETPFLVIAKHKQKQQKKLSQLKEGNYSEKYFYKYREPLHANKVGKQSLWYNNLASSVQDKN